LQEEAKPVLIYATFPSPSEAERIGTALVERGLAACVNIFPQITSIYIWEGKLQRDSETAMLIKTRAQAAGPAMAAVRSLHTYSNPALLVLDVIDGSADFVRWIAAQTARS